MGRLEFLINWIYVCRKEGGTRAKYRITTVKRKPDRCSRVQNM